MKKHILSLLFFFIVLNSSASPWFSFSRSPNFNTISASSEAVWTSTCTGILRIDLNDFSRRLFTFKDSVPANGVTHLCCISEDDIWASKEADLFHFDGVSWSRISNTGITGTISQLLPLHDDTLLIAAQTGIYQLTNMVARRLDISDSLNPNSGSPTFIYRDTHRRMWVGTGNDLYRFDGDTIPLFTYSIGSGVRSMFESEGQLWASAKRGITIMTDDATIVKWPHVDSLIGFNATTLHPASEGDLWIISPFDWSGKGGGVARCRNNEFRIFSKNAGLPASGALAIAEDSSGGIWAGLQDGLNSQGEAETFYLVKFEGDSPQVMERRGNLGSNFIYGIYSDDSANIWVASAGLHKFNGSDWQSWNCNAWNGHNTSVYDIVEDREGNVWFSGAEGVRKYDGETFSEPECMEGNFSAMRCVSLDKNGIIWSGGDGTIIGIDGSSCREFDQFNSIFHGSVSGIAVDRFNSKWITTIASTNRKDGGVYRFDDTSWVRFDTANGISDYQCNAVAIDSMNNVWIGTNRGVSVYDGTSWTYHSRTTGLPSDTVLSIAVDRTGAVCAGTHSGLAIRENDSWVVYDTSDGLNGNWVHTIEVDRHNNIWVGTNFENHYKGISILPRELDFQPAVISVGNHRKSSPGTGFVRTISHNDGVLHFKFSHPISGRIEVFDLTGKRAGIGRFRNASDVSLDKILHSASVKVMVYRVVSGSQACTGRIFIR